MSNVRNFGAKGDGKADDTAAIQHAIQDGDGVAEFPRGNYRITQPLRWELSKFGRGSLQGHGGVAKLIMAGEGPAIHLIGTHTTSADPKSFRPEEWQLERMPTVDGLEIEGAHPQADGIRIEGVVQPTLTRLLLRGLRNAIYVTKRARNLLISHCHIYHNSGVGIHLDDVNLHQAIITGSHVSYCRRGGIRIDNSEIRNLQITGNDIEYNNNRVFAVPDADLEPTAEILFQTGPKGTIREGTISGNTIQATYSPAGANIRFIGDPERGNHLIGNWTITGNLIGSQRINIHLSYARGVSITGNYLYSAFHRNVLIENSHAVIMDGNCFGHNPDYHENELATGIRFVDCEGCVINGLLIEDSLAGKHTVQNAPPLERDALVELIRCRRVNLSGSQILDGTPYGILLEDCTDTLITGTTIKDRRDPKLMRSAVRWQGTGNGNLVAHCRLGKGTEGDVQVSEGVTLKDNVLD